MFPTKIRQEIRNKGSGMPFTVGVPNRSNGHAEL